MIEMLRLHEEYLGQKDAIDQALSQVLAHAQFINGPEVTQFCGSLSGYLNGIPVIPCASGTDALQLALMALDLPKESEIIIPSFSYIAAVEAVALLGYKPVLTDVDADSFCLNVSSLESLITDLTKVIIPVHLFGQSCDMDPIMRLAAENNLYVIEDNAQALGATYTSSAGQTRQTGTIGDIGCHSFFPTKNLGCFGDGGALSTSNAELKDKLSKLSIHGQSKKYNHEFIGLNSRLDTIQAAILTVKLTKLNWRINRQRSIAKIYNERLSNCELLRLPKEFDNRYHTFNQYCIRVARGHRDALKQYLLDRKISSVVYYPKPTHLQKAYSHLDIRTDLSNSEELCSSILAIPSHPLLSDEEIDIICDSILQFCKLNS